MYNNNSNGNGAARARGFVAADHRRRQRHVTALSSRQNHGTPLYLHFCEPKFKECSDVIAYKNSDGLRVALQVHRDVHGATINRLVCKLNEKEDIRVCADFDTGAETTAMQDMDGNWQDVTDSEPPPKKEPKGAVHF